jgi:methionyl-tRNA formyltransferase
MSGVLIFADAVVGETCLDWLIESYKDDIGLVVTRAANGISEHAKDAGLSTCVFNDTDQLLRVIEERDLAFDLGLLIWWPYILRQPLISLPSRGFINTHPSLLPYNRGKHFSFWAIVEQCPFGVTLHRVDAGIDTGDIVAQSTIDFGWEDTGETLLLKAQNAMIALFKEQYPFLRTGEIKSFSQVIGTGSFHQGSEIDRVTRIFLDKPYVARDLLNLLRAKTFEGLPGCRFEENGVTYDVTIKIKEVP